MMKKKNKEEQIQAQQMPAEEKKIADINASEVPLANMAPSEELQIYYNDAYMREKQRFNDIFGIIEEPKDEKQEEAQGPDLSEYVHVDEFKKLKKKLKSYRIAFWIFFLIAIAAFKFK